MTSRTAVRKFVLWASLAVIVLAGSAYGPLLVFPWWAYCVLGLIVAEALYEPWLKLAALSQRN